MRDEAPERPCPRCGEPTIYSYNDVVDLHVREQIDRSDNRYACADQFVPRYNKLSRCRFCGCGFYSFLPADEQPPTVCYGCEHWPPGTGERA